MNGHPSQALTETEVAQRLGLSVATLRPWRLKRTGPPFVRVGSAARYLAPTWNGSSSPARSRTSPGTPATRSPDRKTGSPMSLWKRGRQYWIDAVVRGQRCRERFTRRTGAKPRILSPRMVAYSTENARPLADFFGPTKLRNITPEQISAYQNARIDAGCAQDGQRQALGLETGAATCATLVPLPGRLPRAQEHEAAHRPGVDRRRSEEAVQGGSIEAGMALRVRASALGFCCGLRACEIKDSR